MTICRACCPPRPTEPPISRRLPTFGRMDVRSRPRWVLVDDEVAWIQGRVETLAGRLLAPTDLRWKCA
jgi:hypothetical protein